MLVKINFYLIDVNVYCQCWGGEGLGVLGRLDTPGRPGTASQVFISLLTDLAL